MDFDEVLRRTQSSYCVSLYSRNHMLRSLDRLITVGDKCQVGSGERKTLSITATGKERYYKKKDDYDNSGLCSQWLRAQKLITKYCMHDMIAAIFKVITTCKPTKYIVTQKFILLVENRSYYCKRYCHLYDKMP